MKNISRSKGFSMVEVLVALAIIAVLGAVMIPALNSKLQDSRESAISQTLNGLALGMAEYKKALGRYPGQLSLLSVNPISTSPDLCGTAASTTATLWRGPYISREFAAAGMPMGDGRIQSAVRRSPTTVVSSGTVAYALIDVTGVETSVATDLESQFDGTPDAAGGTIRYTSSSIPAQSGAGVNPTPLIPATSSGVYTVSFAIPINPSGC